MKYSIVSLQLAKVSDPLRNAHVTVGRNVDDQRCQARSESKAIETRKRYERRTSSTRRCPSFAQRMLERIYVSSTRSYLILPKRACVDRKHRSLHSKVHMDPHSNVRADVDYQAVLSHMNLHKGNRPFHARHRSTRLEFDQIISFTRMKHPPRPSLN